MTLLLQNILFEGTFSLLITTPISEKIEKWQIDNELESSDTAPSQFKNSNCFSSSSPQGLKKVWSSVGELSVLPSSFFGGNFGLLYSRKVSLVVLGPLLFFFFSWGTQTAALNLVLLVTCVGISTIIKHVPYNVLCNWNIKEKAHPINLDWVPVLPPFSFSPPLSRSSSTIFFPLSIYRVEVFCRCVHPLHSPGKSAILEL